MAEGEPAINPRHTEVANWIDSSIDVKNDVGKFTVPLAAVIEKLDTAELTRDDYKRLAYNVRAQVVARDLKYGDTKQLIAKAPHEDVLIFPARDAIKIPPRYFGMTIAQYAERRGAVQYLGSSLRTMGIFPIGIDSAKEHPFPDQPTLSTVAKFIVPRYDSREIAELGRQLMGPLYGWEKLPAQVGIMAQDICKNMYDYVNNPFEIIREATKDRQ